IIAYCLMSNHVHLIVVPQEKTGLSFFVNMTHMSYSLHKNKQKKIKGHLWQGRVYSGILDEAHLLKTVRYVEQNPVRAKMVPYAWDYVWSSAREHAGMEKDPIIKTIGREIILRSYTTSKNWMQYLQQEDVKTNEFIRSATGKVSI